MFGGNLILVATRDVLSFALVCSDSFPAESTCVSFLLARYELCRFVWHSVELCGLLSLGTACAVRELFGTSGACFPFPCGRVSSSCARDCVFLTRDMACTTARENLTCPSYPAHCPKRNCRAFKLFSESPFIRSFPICQEVLDISQRTTAFHRVRPPLFIQARLQQYS